MTRAGAPSSERSQKTGLSLVIVEDHAALGKALELLLRHFGHDVIGTANDAEEGYRTIVARRPAVALIDLNLPKESGAHLTRRLIDEDPGLGVLLYTGGDHPELMAEALDCGARGFAFKAGTPEELAHAILVVAAGGHYMDPRIRSDVLSREVTERVGVLSQREREILDAIARGKTGEEAAEELFISPETVRTHLRNAMEKLEAHTRAHAVAIALREGEIDA